MNQPAFNTHTPTEIELEHKFALENPGVEMLKPDDVVRMLQLTSRASLFEQVRHGNFPKPDVLLGSGPTAIRRWLPATVFDFMHQRRKQREQEAA